jgi:hypothetical protein
MRICVLAVVILIAFPGFAFAHGEQILVLPAATVTLVVLSAVGLIGWRVTWRLKSLLLLTLFGIHFSLWVLPVLPTPVTAAPRRVFVELIALPLAATWLVYLLTRRRREAT